MNTRNSAMGKKRYDHRLLACVQRGKCVEGIDLPVINPAENVVEGRISARRKPQKVVEKTQLNEDERLSDEQLVELFLKRQMSQKSRTPGSEVIKISKKGENSLDAALSMLRNKARMREVNKLGAELEDIKDRMVNVCEEYDELLSVTPYSGPLDMEISRIIEIDGLDSWRDSVRNRLHCYANKCREREEVLEDISQDFSDNEDEAPSFETDDIIEVERAGTEISDNLKGMQSKVRRLSYLHYSILKSRPGAKNQGVDNKAHREMDIQRKVVDRFKGFMKVSMERKTRAGAWKYAADEIVGLLKSVREEGTFQMHDIDTSFRKLLSAFNAQQEQLESMTQDLKRQQQVASVTEQEKVRVKNDNIFLQDQLESCRKELKSSQLATERLKNKLNAYLEDINDEDLNEAFSSEEGEEEKEVIYIKRIRKLKSNLEELEKENSFMKSENKSLCENEEYLKALVTEAKKEAENVPDLYEAESCVNCPILKENFQDISVELADEKDKTALLENDLAECQMQIQKNNEELAQLKSQNNKLMQMSQKLESAGPSTISLQSSLSAISAQPSFCPPEVSNDQLSSADESGYTSHEISSSELKSSKRRLSRVEERHCVMVDCSTQTSDEFENQATKTAPLEMETVATERIVNNANNEQEENMRELNRMAEEKDFDEGFTEALDKQVEMICKNIVCLTGLADTIGSPPSSPSEHTDYKADYGNDRETRFEEHEGESDISPSQQDPQTISTSTARRNSASRLPEIVEPDSLIVNLNTSSDAKAEPEDDKLVDSSLKLTNDSMEEPPPVISASSTSFEKSPPAIAHAPLTSAGVSSAHQEADIASVNAPSILLNAPSTNMNAPEATLNAPAILLNAPSPRMNAPEIGINAPTVLLDALSTHMKDPEVAVNAPSNLLPAPSTRINNPEAAVNAPSILLNAPSTRIKAPSTETKAHSVSEEEQSHTQNMKESIKALRSEIQKLQKNYSLDPKSLYSQIESDDAETNMESWNPNFKIQRKNQASFVIYTLKHFAKNSWKKMEGGVRKLLESAKLTDEQKVNQHVKLMAEHAFKILQVMGVSIWNMSKFSNQDYVDMVETLPLVEEEVDDSKLLTDKSGIWLPRIAVRSEHDMVPNNSKEEISYTDSAMMADSEREQNRKNQTLPLIHDNRAGSARKQDPNLLGFGIGGHGLMSSKSQNENMQDATKLAGDSNKRKPTQPPAKQNFRDSRILGKNKKLVELLSKSGKTMQEITAILGLGLNQGNDEDGPALNMRRDTVHVHRSNGIGSLGFTSKPIALPKLVDNEDDQHRARSARKPNQEHKYLAEVLSTSAMNPHELHEKKSKILASGNTHAQKSASPRVDPPLVTGMRVASKKAPQPDAGVVSTSVKKRRVTRKFQPTIKPAAGVRQRNGRLQHFNLLGHNNQASGKDTSFNFDSNKRPSLTGPQHNIRGALVEQRNKRRMSYAMLHHEQTSLLLPKLAINRKI